MHLKQHGPVTAHREHTFAVRCDGPLCGRDGGGEEEMEEQPDVEHKGAGHYCLHV